MPEPSTEEPIVTSPENQRAAQRKMTPEDRERIIELLKREDLRGPEGKLQLSVICRLTGLSYNQITKFVDGDSYWKAQKREVNPGLAVPTEIDLIDRAPPPPLARRTEEQASLFRQSQIVAHKAWQQAGLTEEAGLMFERNERISRQPLGSLVGAMLGGLVSQLAELDLKLEILADRLRNREKSQYGDLQIIKTKEGSDITELEYEKLRLSMLAEKRAIYGTIIKAQVSMMTAERIHREMNGDKGGPKPPFGGRPLNVQTQTGGGVKKDG